MRKIKIRVCDSANWVGGLYYKRNILFALTQNEFIRNNYELEVHSYCPEDLKFFEPFKNDVRLVESDERKKIGKIRALLYEFIHRGLYEFPSRESGLRYLCGVKAIQWIPDFQHDCYPEYFSPDEIELRMKQFKRIQENNLPLILSSNSSLNDFKKFYGEKDNTYVVPFVSYLEPELKKMSDACENDILKKYELDNHRYACISNQFWKHKNHIVVLNAIKRMNLEGVDFKFVFTGYPKDYRDPDYFASLMKLFEDSDVKPYVQILGFIDRTEQIAIMKCASFVIQPSLFEGWGTVVEDAKVLDKTILLSDIPIHREQMNDKCKLFDPNDPDALADLISREIKEEHIEDISAGIADMYNRAKEYSKGFEQLLRDQERNFR